MARFLPRLLNALQAQHGVILDVIIVDRESTDDSRALIARYPKVKVVSEAAAEHLFFCYEDM